MRKLKAKILHASGVFFLLTTCNIPVHADDTDIYLGLNDLDNKIKPNILFIMDTSGSMGDSIDVTIKENPFDPAATYTGTYSDNSVYYVYSSGDQFAGITPKSKFVCQDAIDKIAVSGFTITRLAEARGDEDGSGNREWKSPLFDDAANDTDEFVECRNDSGVHGQTSASADVYTSSSGWNSVDDENTFSWSSSRSKTFKVANLNYANYLTSASTVAARATRFTVMRDVLVDLLPFLENVNVGLMRFSGGSGGRITLAVKDIDSGTVREDFKDALDDFPILYCDEEPVGGGNKDCPGTDGQPGTSNTSTDYVAGWFTDMDGSTPLSETLYEAKRYFAGQSPKYDSSTTVDGLFTDDDSKFKSPIVEECQPNFAILLTDGKPTSDSGSDTDIISDTNTDDYTTICSTGYPGDGGNGACIDELAGYLAGSVIENADGTTKYDWSETDLLSTLDSKQRVKVYPIGFAGAGLESLTNGIAQYAGTTSYKASNALELEKAFREIFSDIEDSDASLVAPAVTVSAFNQLQHSNNVFFALFKPGDSVRWQGNVKNYKVDSNGDILGQSETGDVNPAVIRGTDSEADNSFQEKSRSFWSENTDGHSVLAGGFASQLPADRKLYTYTHTYTYTGTDFPKNIDLTLSANRVETGTTELTKELLEITLEDDDYRDNLIRWARGQDAFDEDGDGDITEPHHIVADPMHSRPLVVTYGGTESAPDSVLFFGDNMGMLHAVDVDDGQEIFSFIPQKLLPNINLFYENAPSLEKVYGLDGPLVAWVNEDTADDDKEIASADEHVILYVGMRRGGNSYYAIDVTDRDKPVLLFEISPDSGGEFTELGQTWSTPKLAKIRWDCPAINDDGTGGCGDDDFKEVLVFGGGYDKNNQDTTIPTQDDSIGRAIFMVDARTGEPVFSAGIDTDANHHDFESADMTHSFPADVTFIDLDADGFQDTLFATDIKGQVWRFDFKRIPTDEDILADGGMIADLSATTTVSGFNYPHRYFSAPDVAFFNPSGVPAYLTIGLGSGYRARPLGEEMQDKYYLFRDPNVFNLPTSYEYFNKLDADFAIESTRLLEASDLGDPEADTPDLTYGWARSLPIAGEKSLSRSITFNGRVAFTTFAPTPDGEATCGGDLGVSQFYYLDHKTGDPVANLDEDVGNTLDASKRLKGEGIPPEPSVIFADKTVTIKEGTPEEETYRTNKALLFVGRELVDEGDLEPVNKAYWRVNDDT